MVWIVLLVLAAGVIARIVTWRNPGVIISPETTFITWPLRADGTVDYLAAINERSSQGVTPENNAAVLLLQALGPAAVPEQNREQFFQMLGIDPLPEKGPYLEEFGTYFGRRALDAKSQMAGQEPGDFRDETAKELNRIMSRPWTKADSPIAAAWLDDNRRQIDLFVAATRRSRFYMPLTEGRNGAGLLIFELLPWVSRLHVARWALCSRAMLRIGEGKSEEAWQDLLACHRLARLMDQAPTVVEGVVAEAVEEMADQADAALHARRQPHRREGAAIRGRAGQVAADDQDG